MKMTNSEYFEKNKISFAKAMKIFNAQKDNGVKFFDKFLASKHYESKFKVGDIVVLQRDRILARYGWTGWKHNAVMRIVKIDWPNSMYFVEFLTPDGHDYIGRVKDLSIKWIDKDCIPY